MTMNTESTEALSDRELAEAIAILMGWEKHECEHTYPRSGCQHGTFTYWEDHWVNGASVGMPAYVTSIDALEPVEARLREAGWLLMLLSPSDGHGWYVEWRAGPHGLENAREREHAFASAEPRARAEAALQALQAIAKVEA